MPKYQKHIFVCTNEREKDHPRGSCQGESLQKKLKKSLAEHGVHAVVRANKAGCLDQCEHGPTIVVYPEAVWYGHVSEDDINQIVTDHIVGGTPVERLVLPDSCLNTATCIHKRPK